MARPRDAGDAVFHRRRRDRRRHQRRWPGQLRHGHNGAGGLAEAILRERVLGLDVERALSIGALVDDPRQLRQPRNGRPLSIELPLWDLLGKVSGQPVARLLGGYRERVKAYCSTGSLLSPEQHVEQALDAYDRGYRAIKLRLHRRRLDDDLEVVRTIRDALGDGMEIMADANQQQNPFWSRADALRAARALQELGVVWLEEPLPMYDAEGLALLAAAVDIPIAGAENEYRLPAYSALLERRALDIVQPDLVGCGGLLEFRKIAAVAESHQTWALPHVWDHGLTLLCSLHAIGSVPNAPYAECTDDFNWPAACATPCSPPRSRSSMGRSPSRAARAGASTSTGRSSIATRAPSSASTPSRSEPAEDQQQC